MSTSAPGQGRPLARTGAVLESHAPTTKRRMLVIVNPHAAAVSHHLREVVLYALRGGFDVDAVDTEARGHATELSREAAHEGYDVVVAFGGDGTVNEVANGLLGSPTPVCPLPGGSANVFAKLLGLPGDLIDATEYVLEMADDWRTRKVDLGSVNGRCFTFASGLGLDARVVERVDSNPRLKARLGSYYFAWVAVTTVVRRYLIGPARMRVEAAGATIEGVTAIVQNGPHFTYFHERPIEVAVPTDLDSGSLTGCVLHRATPLGLPFIGWRALSRRAAVVGHRQVTGFSDAAGLTVRATDDRALPLEVDGDYIGEVTEARYDVLPGALNVVG
jgi:diacylglycerol kinase family enzyme